MVSTVGACELTRWTQPPDAENRMSGGVGGLTGAIPLVRPDHFCFHQYIGRINHAQRRPQPHRSTLDE